jgi:hypothetical protein
MFSAKLSRLHREITGRNSAGSMLHAHLLSPSLGNKDSTHRSFDYKARFFSFPIVC